VIAAYLLLVSKVYENAPLQKYVSRIIEERNAQQQMCRYLELKQGIILVQLVAKNKKYSESTKHRTVTIFFEKDQVVDLVYQIPAIQQEYGNPKKLLLRKYVTRDKLQRLSSTGSISKIPIVPGFLGHHHHHHHLQATQAATSIGESQIADHNGNEEHHHHHHTQPENGPLVMQIPVDDEVPQVKAVTTDALRKVMLGSERASLNPSTEMSGVTMLLAAEHYSEASHRCAENALERARVYGRIMAFVLDKQKGEEWEKEDPHNPLASLSSLSSLRLDLMNPPGSAGLLRDYDVLC